MFDFKRFILDLLFPISCLGCGQEGVWVCPSCAKGIKLNLLAKPLQVKDLAGVFVAADYQDKLVSQLIKNFKYNFVVDLGENLADILVRYLQEKIKLGEVSHFDFIIPVPLAKKRKRWRGFNQSEIIANRISQEFGWPLLINCLSRQFNHHPQVGLSAADRKINVQGLFTVKNEEILKNKSILLIDDVVTTGSTLRESALALKASGVAVVWALVVAKD